MKTMLEILKIIKEEHLDDINVSQACDIRIYGLCTLAKYYLSHDDSINFNNYLKQSTGHSLSTYIWARDNDNKERLNWLNKNIEILKHQSS